MWGYVVENNTDYKYLTLIIDNLNKSIVKNKFIWSKNNKWGMWVGS